MAGVRRRFFRFLPCPIAWFLEGRASVCGFCSVWGGASHTLRFFVAVLQSILTSLAASFHSRPRKQSRQQQAASSKQQAAAASAQQSSEHGKRAASSKQQACDAAAVTAVAAELASAIASLQAASAHSGALAQYELVSVAAFSTRTHLCLQARRCCSCSFAT